MTFCVAPIPGSPPSILSAWSLFFVDPRTPVPLPGAASMTAFALLRRCARRGAALAKPWWPTRARLVALFEALPRILMVPSRPPFRRAFDPRHPGRELLLLRRIPQLAAREPLQHDMLVRAAELIRRREQLVSVAGAKRRRSVVDEDGPVCVPRWHRSQPRFLSQRLIFSTSVVRLMLSSLAARPLLPRVRSSERSISSRSMLETTRSRSTPSSGR